MLPKVSEVFNISNTPSETKESNIKMKSCIIDTPNNKRLVAEKMEPLDCSELLNKTEMLQANKKSNIDKGANTGEALDVRSNVAEESNATKVPTKVPKSV